MMVDNGHTIQVNYAAGSFMRVEGKQYDLLQIEFHRPSEEKISGKGHEMEAQLIHRASDGKLAIVAVLLDSGKENPLIKTVWSNLPQEKGKANSRRRGEDQRASTCSREKKDYYTYAGSLTTPPCTEDVTWFVLKTPVQISADEIARFAKVYPMNARPVQPRTAGTSRARGRILAIEPIAASSGTKQKARLGAALFACCSSSPRFPLVTGS